MTKVMNAFHLQIVSLVIVLASIIRICSHPITVLDCCCIVNCWFLVRREVNKAERQDHEGNLVGLLVQEGQRQ